MGGAPLRALLADRMGGRADPEPPRAMTRRGDGEGGMAGHHGRRWVILVDRAQPDLREHMRKAFASDSQVRIIEASEADGPKHSEKITRRLRIHGAALLREEEDQCRYAP